jgi:hypothetical protein
MKSLEGGHFKFGKNMTDYVNREISKSHQKYQADYKEILENVMLDRAGRRRVLQTLSPEQQLFSRLWWGYVEIEDSYEVLPDVAVYIRRFPSNLGEIPKVRYLQYHIGSFLNEVYILLQRLDAYTKTVTRSYRKDDRLKAMAAQLDSLNTYLSGFSRIVEVRGSHVHVVRYSDEGLDRLSLLELLSRDGKPGVNRVLFQFHLRETRKKWVRIIGESVGKIQQILDAYFDVLNEIIFDGDGELIVPFKRTSK